MSPVNSTRRSPRSISLGLSLVVASLAALLAVSPAAASVEMGHVGVVGPHNFLDTYADPGVACNYATVSDGDVWRGKLAHIDVNPPSLNSISGEQLVGWRFIVRRYRHIYEPGRPRSVSDPYTVTYRSPIQQASATESVVADLERMGVDVSVPPGTLKRNWDYLIVIKSIWYRPNGNRQGTATDRLRWYGVEGSSNFDESLALWCPARLATTQG